MTKDEIQNIVRDYCKKHVNPYMEEDDRNQNFRSSIYEALGGLGLAGMRSSPEFEGMGLGHLETCWGLEAVAQSSVAYAVTLSVSSMVQSYIETFGNDEQKQKYLPSLATGKTIGCFCLSETGAGSDAKGLKTSAKQKGDSFVLNGSKMWISSAGIAEVYIVMAKEDESISAFLVPKDCSGLSFGKKEDKIGWRASPTREVILNNVIVPLNHRLGPKGKGLSMSLNQLQKGRISIGAIAVGLAQACLDQALVYAHNREQFGKSLLTFQGIEFMLAQRAIEIEAARSLVEKAALLSDEKKESSKLASMAKVFATDTAMKTSIDAIQVHGGVGITKEYPVERFMRDAKILQIVEGTNEIQKTIISRHLKKEIGL